jgi:hypothetical protein
MARITAFAIFGVLLLIIGAAKAGPTIGGHYREQFRGKLDRRVLAEGNSYEFREDFRANERACVIVEGDQVEKSAKLSLEVFDAAGKLVAADTAGGNCVVAIWFPPRTQQYRIAIKNGGSHPHRLDIVVK